MIQCPGNDFLLGVTRLKCCIVSAHLIRIPRADLPAVQWAAVTTHRGWTSVPPQKGKPEVDRICACHGQAPWGASEPPTIRALGLYPHWPELPLPPPPPFPPPPFPPPPFPPLPPPHWLQLFLQLFFMNCSYWPLQNPLLAQFLHSRFLSVQADVLNRTKLLHSVKWRESTCLVKKKIEYRKWRKRRYEENYYQYVLSV